MRRIFARIGDMGANAQTTHFTVSGSMAWPDVIIVEEDSPGGGAMAYRYRRDGTFCGDTWAEHLEIAQEDAEDEYGDKLGVWLEVPPDAGSTDRAIDYAIARANDDRQALN